MKIVIDPFDIKSINQAIKQIDEYQREFELKEQEFVRRLAEIGVSVARAKFKAALYAGENDVVVDMNQDGTLATIIASGKAVGFIEFGTGVRHPEWVDTNHAGEGPPYTPDAHGTYGKGLAKNGKWVYRGNPGNKGHVIADDIVITSGNDPAYAMLTARDKMIEEVTRIAREVWK